MTHHLGDPKHHNKYELYPFKGDPEDGILASPVLRKLSRKMELATQRVVVKRHSATLYQITNYGLGGLCETHMDPSGI